MGQVVSLYSNLESVVCWVEGCGLHFAVQQQFLDTARAKGTSFYCPRGHHIRYGEGEVDRLKKELAEKERRLEMEKNRRAVAERLAETARKGAAIANGKLKAVKTRVGNGVCPCCNRTFQNLMRHMHTKHPEYRP